MRFAVERVAVERFAVERFAVERVEVARFVVERAAAPRFAVPRAAPVLRPPAAVLRAPVPAARPRAAVVRPPAAAPRFAPPREDAGRPAAVRPLAARPRPRPVPASFSIVSIVAASAAEAVFFRISLPMREAVRVTFAAVREPAALRAPVARPRDAVVFFAVVRFAVVRDPVERDAVLRPVLREDVPFFAIAIVLLSEKLNFATQRLHQLGCYIVMCAQVQVLHVISCSKV